MEEIAPGVWHWTAFRETIGNEVSSYYLAEERVALDPMLPPERPEWFRPEHAILTTRHHDRDAWKLGSTVWVVAQGAHEFEGRGEFRTYEWGDDLPGGLHAYEVGSLSPDDSRCSALDELPEPERRSLHRTPQGTKLQPEIGI